MKQGQTEAQGVRRVLIVNFPFSCVCVCVKLHSHALVSIVLTSASTLAFASLV